MSINKTKKHFVIFYFNLVELINFCQVKIRIFSQREILKILADRPSLELWPWPRSDQTELQYCPPPFHAFHHKVLITNAPIFSYWKSLGTKEETLIKKLTCISLYHKLWANKLNYESLVMNHKKYIRNQFWKTASWAVWRFECPFMETFGSRIVTS